MRLLIVGKSGQLARAIAAETDSANIEAVFLSHQDLDLSSEDVSIRQTLQPHLKDTDAVIIAAAYTAVDAAEGDYETARTVNGRSPGIIAQVCAEDGKPVVHISTDYVFSGDGMRPYRPDDPIAPLNAYGRSKAEGEAAVQKANRMSAILRTSWVYDTTGKNFLTTMLRLAKDRSSLSVVADQIGRPTYAQDLAQASIATAEHLFAGNKKAAGIFHVSNTGEPISWADFARAIFDMAGVQMDVIDIPSSDYPTHAKRPAYSVMDTSTFEQTIGMDLPDWRDGLHRALEERP